MKNLSVSKRNSGAASVATKAFAWMLSIMLVVTGISPSFAANKKAAGASKKNNTSTSKNINHADVNKNHANSKAKGTKNRKTKASAISKKKAVALKKTAAAKAYVTVSDGFFHLYKNNDKASKLLKKNINPNESLKTKAAKSIKQSTKTLNTKENPSKDQNDKNGKKNKIASKGDKYFMLSNTGNVGARFTLDKKSKLKYLLIFIQDKARPDKHIQKLMWIEMVKALGGKYNETLKQLRWGDDKINVSFETDGIYLPSDSSNLFQGCQGKITGCEKLNTSEVTNMSGMFLSTREAYPDVKKWDVHNVKDMSHMFAYSVSTPVVKDWDVHNVTNMAGMFEQALNFRGYGISEWNTGSVTNMSYMFSNTVTINSFINLGGWNVSNVLDMEGMFFGSWIKAVDISEWKLNHKLYRSNRMFEKCKYLEHLRLPQGLKTTISAGNRNYRIVKLLSGKPVTVEKENINLQPSLIPYTINEKNELQAMYRIFDMNYVDVIFDKNDGDSEAWINHAVVDLNKSIATSNPADMPATNPTRIGYTFLGWSMNKNATTPDFNRHTVLKENTTVYAVWKRITEFPLNASGNVKAKLDSNKKLSITATSTSGDMKIDRSKWDEMVKMLGGYYPYHNWEGLDVKNISFETNGIYLPEDSRTFFLGFKGEIYGCERLNTSYVKRMSDMFSLTKKANPNVSNWNTSNVTNMGSMFYGAVNANPDVSNWNTSKVENMDSMFYCAERANPDVSKWNTSNVTNMMYMLSETSVRKLDLTKWNLKSLQNNGSAGMFRACDSLEYLKTPAGLSTTIGNINKNFDIVKLKKGNAVTVEARNKNLNNTSYVINRSNDKQAVYHIYRKDKYVGVTFAKNGGNTEGWINHDIVEKGKQFSAGGGKFPSEDPTRTGRKFMGWATSSSATESNFSISSTVSDDIAVYAVWSRREFLLNNSGNVKANLDNKNNLTITAVKTSGDMNIERGKWREMLKMLGGNYSNVWKDVDVKNISFETNGIYLPIDSSDFFKAFKGEIDGCGKLNTSKVANMSEMFSYAKNVDRTIANWDVSNVGNMVYMFKGSGLEYLNLSAWKLNLALLIDPRRCTKMFEGCSYLECLKTPEGLSTDINGANANFKIVKLKKGAPVSIEKESQNLNSEYVINASNDKQAIYHIYRKDKCAGVIFDKNGGDTESWINHDAVYIKSPRVGSAKMPEQIPTRSGYTFLGWAKTKTATQSSFIGGIKVYNDMVVYAVWSAKAFPLNASKNINAVLDSDNNLNISAVNTSGDMHIDRQKWIDMVVALGGSNLQWTGTKVKGINFQTDGIYLPKDSSSLFSNYTGGEINGLEKLKTDDVTNMNDLFINASSKKLDVSNWNTSNVIDMSFVFMGVHSANPDVSKWNTSNVTTMEGMFFSTYVLDPDVSNWDVSKVINMQETFYSCLAIKKLDLSKWRLNPKLFTEQHAFDAMFGELPNIEYIKTPMGLQTSILGADSDFKVVKLEKGTAAHVEFESKNLNASYEINSSGDKDAVYHIYRKDKYAGVTFNRNGGDREAWVNHEIVEKGKSFKDAGGKEPVEKPSKEGYLSRGWAYKNSDKSPTFSDDKDKKIENDLTVYAVYKHIHEIPLNDSGNVYVLPKIETTGRVTLEIKAKNPSGDMDISKKKWDEMAKEFGADDSYLRWKTAGDQIDIHFLAMVKAPSDMYSMFGYFAGNIEGLDKFDVSNVHYAGGAFQGATGKVKGSDFANWKTGKIENFRHMFMFSNINPDVSKWDMSSAQILDRMFYSAKEANPDVTNWNVKSVLTIDGMFYIAEKANPDISKWRFNELSSIKGAFAYSNISKADMSKWNFKSPTKDAAEDAFNGCKNLEYLKTPLGLTLKIGPGGSSLPFKIVRLKKGMPAEVENSGVNLETSDITLNKENDKDVAYDVYCMKDDMYVGVTFDVNGGDKESFRNHEIVNWGEAFVSVGGEFPLEEPSKKGYRFIGWDEYAGAESAGFTENTNVTEDLKVYAIYEKKVPAKVKFNCTGGEPHGVPATIDSFIGDSLDDKFPVEQPVKKGYDFIGWSKRLEDANTGVVTPGYEFNKDTVISADTTDVYAVWNARTIPLNASKNVNAKLDNNNNLNIFAVSTSGDMNIERQKWIDMAVVLGAVNDPGQSLILDWKNVTKVNTINFIDSSIYLPSNCGCFFSRFKGKIEGCGKLKTDKVTNMDWMFYEAINANPDVSKWDTSKVTSMNAVFALATSANPNVSTWNTSKVNYMTSVFYGANNANPDVSKWDVSNVTVMSGIFGNSGITKADLSNWKLHQDVLNNFDSRKKMFDSCGKLEYLKTPVGLKTTISKANSDFKIVKLKKGTAATVEAESKNLDAEYVINSSADKDAVYHIYRKDKYVGVTFNKNGGDSEAWVNHDMVEKGKSFKDAGGKEPVEKPSKEGYLSRGWAYKDSDKSPTFSDGKDKKIENDLTVYAVYKHVHEIPLNDSGNVYVMPKLETTGRTTLEIKAKNPSGDMTISRDKWLDMATEFGAELGVYGGSVKVLNWAAAGNQIDIRFEANVKAPNIMNDMFNETKGNIEGLDRLDVSNVKSAQRIFFSATGKVKGSDFANWKTGSIEDFDGMFQYSNINPDVSKWDMSSAQNLSRMFSNARSANPDVSRWNLKNVSSIEYVFNGARSANPDTSKWQLGELKAMSYAFASSNIEKLDMSKWKIKADASTGEEVSYCKNLKYIKTPLGLTLKIGPYGSPLPFKIVRLKKGMPAKVENSGISLETSNITLNKENDKDVAYDVYCMKDDMYVGVTFDVNGGNKDSFRNHEIVQKGKSIKESGGTFPEEKPEKDSYRFKGWDKYSGAEGSGNFKENTVVNEDTKVYAIYEKKVPAKVKFNATGGDLGSVPTEVNTYIGDSLGISSL